jgi:cell division protease FtsH
LSFGKKEDQIFLGREISQHRDFGEETARKIDEEVHSIVTGAYEKTCQLIRDNLDTMHRMAAALLEKETLTAADIDEIMAGDQDPGAKNRAKSKKEAGLSEKVKPGTASDMEETDVEPSESGKE